MATQILSKMSFVNKIADIMKATSDDEKPIPGYLYKEVSQITHSSGDNCELCVGFLSERLLHDSSHVKLKVLKLMRYIVENGHTNFRLGLMKNLTGIQKATQFSGPLDPLHGEMPYRTVRKTAKELVEEIFDPDASSLTTGSADRPTINTVGIGSFSPPEGLSPGKMEGFGNTSTIQHDKSLGDNIKASLFKMAEKLGDSSEANQRELLSNLEGSTGYTPPRLVTFHNTSPPPVTQTPVVRPKEVSPPKYVAGKAGGGWDDSDDDVTDDVTSDRERSRSAHSGSLGHCDQRVEQDTLNLYAAEVTVISSYLENTECTESILLKRSQLKDFLKECSGLNCDKIVELLATRTSAQSTQDGVVMRSLMLLEVLVYSDLVNLERLVHMCKDGLVTVYKTRTGQSQSKARKLIRILEKLTSHHSILPLPGDEDMASNET